jgi:hypothetical protein
MTETNTASSVARTDHEADADAIAEQHVHDSSSVAPSRADQPGILMRSPAMWVLYLLTAFVIAGLGYMALHTSASQAGMAHGSEKQPAPRASQ